MIKNLTEIENEIEKFRNENPLDDRASEVIELVRYDQEIEEDGSITTEIETIGFINQETPIFTAERWNNDKYYGCNLYADIDDDLILLETYDDTDEITGRERAENVIKSIEDGFATGATYIIISND